MNKKLKWRTAGLRRGAVILGVVGLAAGAAFMTAGSALAGVGSQPGDLALSATSGALSSTPTWSTTDGCPSGFQGSAQLAEFAPGATAGATPASRISPTVASVTTAFSGTLDGNVGALLNTAGVNATTPGTSEWAVGCWTGAGGTGSVEYVQSTFVTVASGATTYTTSSTGPVVTATTTTLTASPSPATTGATVTLTASVTAADGTVQPGTVQFEVGGTDIGSPVDVNSGGTATPATTTTTFSSAGTEALTAVFTPTNSTTYSGSTGSFSLSVEQSGSLPATGSPVPISVTVPTTGTLSVSVVNTAVPLTVNSAGTVATGTLGNVTITDSRNDYPGWSVTGQQSNFTGSGSASGFSISGDQEGWVPAAVGSLVDGAVLGATVAPGTNPDGLGDTGATLISATPGNGFGTNVANAALTLDIPAGQVAGAYAGSMTVTYLSVGP
jgi:hypothetical protein